MPAGTPRIYAPYPPPRNTLLSPEDTGAPRLDPLPASAHRVAQLTPDHSPTTSPRRATCIAAVEGGSEDVGAIQWLVTRSVLLRGEAAPPVNARSTSPRRAPDRLPEKQIPRLHRTPHELNNGKNNNYPKLHNAMWPGIVGKGSARRRADHPARHAAGADRQRRGRRPEVRRRRPLHRRAAFRHRQRPDAVKRMADQIASYGLKVGSFVAPIWGGAGGGSAMGAAEERKRFLTQVRKACEIGQQMRELGIRPTGGIRIDSSSSVEAWDKDPEGNTKLIAETFREGGEDRRGPRRVPRGRGRDLLGRHAFLARERRTARDGRHARRRRLPGRHGALDALHARLQRRAGSHPARGLSTGGTAALDAAYKKVADALRPWTLDFHVAQNDGTVFGSGDHEKTGRHCRVDDPNGRLDIVKHAGYWLRDDKGELTKTMRHICWDGCMFPNAVMEKQETWNDVLGAMIKVRDAHGWSE